MSASVEIASIAPPAPRLLIQIVETAPGSMEIRSPLPGALVVEILLKLLPGAWDAAKQSIKDKQPVVRPRPSLVTALRRGWLKTNGKP